MPSWELFEHQLKSYRDSVIPPTVTARVCVEQASTFGWARYAGLAGEIIGMTSFGASAPLKAPKEIRIPDGERRGSGQSAASQKSERHLRIRAHYDKTVCTSPHAGERARRSVGQHTA